jgi:HJR/Mrr/RecB family endonuclease
MRTKNFILPVVCLLILIPITSLAGKLYKWVDEKGVTHVTDDPEKVPEEYIGSVKELTPQNKLDNLVIKIEDIWKDAKGEKVKIAVGIAGLIIITALYKLLRRTKLITNEKKREKHLKALDQSGIDVLDLAQYQKYIRALLTRQGFNLRTPEGSFNLGVDLIAEKDKSRYAVQIKRQTTPISGAIVNDLEREKHRYGCDRSMIISNNYFTDDAVERAGSSGCTLIDRKKLGEWILQFGKKD